MVGMSSRAIATVVALASQLAGCSSPEPALSLDAKAGAVCQDCTACTSTTSSCVCHTCTNRAQDTQAKVLLSCSGGVWTVLRKCPGGVSVSCTSSAAYAISCLDESGKPVPY